MHKPYNNKPINLKETKKIRKNIINSFIHQEKNEKKDKNNINIEVLNKDKKICIEIYDKNMNKSNIIEEAIK